MPLPLLASILNTIGGMTSWNIRQNNWPGQTIGSGTFLVHNTQYVFNGSNSPNYLYLDPGSVASQTTLIQGSNLNYPDPGTGTYNFTTPSGFQTGVWDNGEDYHHIGWAIKLSDVTSGGLSGDGSFGGGIQSG
jgi:hypothetical protein